jgi:hypothetical protein
MLQRIQHLFFIISFSLSAGIGAAEEKKKTPTPSYQAREGDILFQSLFFNDVVHMIEHSTGSPYSHCGIVVLKEGKWMVLQAIGPVKETSLQSWTEQGRGGNYAVYRLKPEFQRHIPGMIAAARRMMGRPYDIQYEMDDEKIYCSELIYKAYQATSGDRLGLTCTLADLDWKPHVATIKAITGGRIPLEREMITPRALSAARQLELVLPMREGKK